MKYLSSFDGYAESVESFKRLPTMTQHDGTSIKVDGASFLVPKIDSYGRIGEYLNQGKSGTFFYIKTEELGKKHALLSQFSAEVKNGPHMMIFALLTKEGEYIYERNIHLKHMGVLDKADGMAKKLKYILLLPAFYFLLTFMTGDSIIIGIFGALLAIASFPLVVFFLIGMFIKAKVSAFSNDLRERGNIDLMDDYLLKQGFVIKQSGESLGWEK